jgi:hypothetical protein
VKRFVWDGQGWIWGSALKKLKYKVWGTVTVTAREKNDLGLLRGKEEPCEDEIQVNALNARLTSSNHFPRVRRKKDDPKRRKIFPLYS